MTTDTLIKSEPLINAGKLWDGYVFVEHALIEKYAQCNTTDGTDEIIESVTSKIIIFND
jgi:hypothetical protein